MDMPKPGPEHRQLARLAGSWVGQETLRPTPWDAGGPAIGRLQARIGLDGFYLIADYEQERGGRVNFRGHGVYGWDPRGQCYTMHWFDSTGVEHGAPGFGAWEGDTLTLVHETKHLGFSRYVYQIGDGEYRLRIDNSPDGREWTPFLEGQYRRVE